LALAADAHAQAEVFFGVTRNQGIDASSYNAGSFVITNESSSGIAIERFRIDFSTAMLPDMVFDPEGDAGDTAAKCFEPFNGEAETGLVDPANPCTSPFSEPRAGGYDVLEIEFTDFDPNETFNFSVDADPTSIKGTSGQGGNSAGSVSGLELAGSTIEVEFSNGTTRTGELFRQSGSSGGAECTLAANPPGTPGLQAVGITSPATVASASQTIRVTGTVGSSVRLLQVEASMDLNGGSGFDIDPFEGNRAIVVSEKTGTIGANGRVDIDVTLTRAGSAAGFNYFTAVFVTGGRTGPTSPVVVLALDDECDSNGDCADGNPCTTDTCSSGNCSNANNSASCDDGLFCNGDDSCSGGSCSTHDGDPCSSGGQCADQCNETTDSCNDPAGTACSGDGNACTDDECSGSGSCVHPNNTASCDDGLFCNGDDTCSAGSCSAHDGDPCSSGGECADDCDEDTDSCDAPAGTSCTGDGDVCTDDECSGDGACVHPANTASCDDGDACTTGDACSNEVCVGTSPVDCDDSLACDGVEDCDGELGCQAGDSVDCSSLDADCTVGSCEENPTECAATPANEGEPCDDIATNGCWANLRCEDGACVGDSLCDQICEACGDEGACLPLCGHPLSPAEGPVLASDALFALQAAIRIRECPSCVCDANDDGQVAATDALIVLARSVAPETALDCPPSEPALDTSGSTTTSTTLP
jgi:hypothetical protein